MVTPEQNYAYTIGEQLAAIDGVTQVFYTKGDVDFVVMNRVQNRDQLNNPVNEIAAIEDVNKISSRFVRQEFDATSGVVVNLTPEM